MKTPDLVSWPREGVKPDIDIYHGWCPPPLYFWRHVGSFNGYRFDLDARDGFGCETYIAVDPQWADEGRSRSARALLSGFLMQASRMCASESGEALDETAKVLFDTVILDRAVIGEYRVRSRYK